MAENIVIKELLDNPFLGRPLHDKLRIVSKRWTYSTITQFNTSS